LTPTLFVAGPADAALPLYALHYLTLPNHKVVVLRWNPCRAHTYKVNVAAVPAASRNAVLAETFYAMRVLAARTGVPFTYRGQTAEIPQINSYARQSAELIIAYTIPGRVGHKTNYNLAGAIAGMGGYSGGWRSVSNGVTTTYSAGISKGMLVLDTPDLMRLSPGFGAGRHRGNVLLHELGHVVGLAHVNNARELMYPAVAAYTPNGFAAGDIAGLRRVGRPAGCIAGW